MRLNYDARRQQAIEALQARVKQRLEELKHEINDEQDEQPHTGKCTVCGGIGYVQANVPPGDYRYNNLYPCPANCDASQQLIQRRADSILSKSGLPSGYREYTIANWFDMDTAHQDGKFMAVVVASEFVNSPRHLVNFQRLSEEYRGMVPDTFAHSLPKPGIVFFGDYGMGKTSLAAAIVNGLAAKGEMAVFIRTADCIDEIQATYHHASEKSTRDVMRVFEECPVLVLDDFNLEKSTEDRREKIEQIIRIRGGNDRATIITCNVDQQAARQAWGSRTAEILNEKYHWIEVGGLPLRPQEMPLF